MFQLLSSLPRTLRNLLDKEHAAIYQAGYVDEKLNPTKVGYRRAFQILMEDKDFKAKLAKAANLDLTDRKNDREDTK